jgi:hypothetical protein
VTADPASPHRRLFISHSSEDKPFVNRLVARLDALGVERPWYDVLELGPTTADISESIRAGISKAAVFCLVLSPRSANSQWVSLEIAEASDRDARTLVALYDAPDGPGPFLLQNPFVNQLLRGGQHMVIDFADFDGGLTQLLRAVAPELGKAFEVDRRLHQILEDPDPDEAEQAMSFAALEPDLYIESLLEYLPKVSDAERVAHRVERALVHLRNAAVPLLWEFLVARRVPEGTLLAPPVDPDFVDDEHGDVYVGDRFTDMLRYMIMSGGNRRWFAQRGASRCLIATAAEDLALRRSILDAIQAYLEHAINLVPSIRDSELKDVEWDSLRLVLETAAGIGPADRVDPFLVKQALSDALWGDNALEAAVKLGPYAVRCLSAYGTSAACASLLDIARWEGAVRSVYFEHSTGVVSPNPFANCFVGFGAAAVDGLLSSLQTHGEPFVPFAYRNLARIRNVRAASATLRYALSVLDDDLLVQELLVGVGFTGVPQACDELLRVFLAGELDRVRNGVFKDEVNAALIAAVGHAATPENASEACERLIGGIAPVLYGQLSESIAAARLLNFVTPIEEWRTTAAFPYVRGRSAVALASLKVFKDAHALHEQLGEAEPDVEAPLVGVALSYFGDERAIEPLVHGLRSTFQNHFWTLHDEYAQALDRIPGEAASAARKKWYKRV